jgi:serine/threonine protein phosphatase PrpC
LPIEIGARTDTGRIRANNEDNYRVVPELNLFVVSDGMGGEAHGEVASAMAVEGVANHCLAAANNLSLPFFGERRPEFGEKTNRLASALRQANRTIHEAAAQNRQHSGMGATLVAAWIEEQRLSLAHVGDSRAYLLRAGALQQLTHDHSLVAEQVRQGILTPQEAETSNLRSVLTRALGPHEEAQVDLNEHALQEGDTLLLCTDGLTRMVTDPEIASTLLTVAAAQAAADRLVELANEYGGEDNTTVVVVRLTADSSGWLGKRQRPKRRHADDDTDAS